MKLALVDFCETLVDFQTADEFVLYIASKKSFKTFVVKEFVRRLLKSMRILRGDKNKKFLLSYLKGLTELELEVYSERYHKEKVRNSIIKNTLLKVEKLKSEGYEIALVSGGYSSYINYFAAEFGFKYVIATDIEVSAGIVTGRIDGLNCMGVNKLYKLKTEIDLESINYDQCYVFSDHESDIYLYCLGRNRYVVEKYGYNQAWANLIGCEVLKK